MAPKSVLASAKSTSRANDIPRDQQAHELADRLPDILIEAKLVSASIAHGLHGRRRAGTGETFWQFRPYEQSDSASLIDWRRTASSDGIFVREREWEAAHTVWLWPDMSRSMEFQSHLSHITKGERAVVLMLALTEILVRSGERVALLGLTRPSGSRHATARLAEELALNPNASALVSGLPPKTSLPRYSGTVLFSDFLDPIDEISERLTALASEGVAGHLVQVLDPAEETLPYDGRVEFFESEGSERWIADRTQSVRADYQKKLEAHRDALREVTQRLGWSLLIHHTDRPATEPLLSLITRMQSGISANFGMLTNSSGATASAPAKTETKTGTVNATGDQE